MSEELLRQRFNEYFTTLTTDDNVRLEAQSKINLTFWHDPKYYGEIIQAWLRQYGDKAVIRDFLMDFLSFLPDAQKDAPEMMKKICAVLDVSSLAGQPDATKQAPDGEQSPEAEQTVREEQTSQTPSERGGEALRLLTPFFK